MAPRSSTAIPIARPRLARRPPDAPSCGRTTSIGTTARSCTTSRPIITRLASVWVTPAADEHLQDDGGAGDGDHRAEPDRFADRHAERRRPRRAAASAQVSRIWMGPPISATRRTGWRSRKESSRPREKSRSATPISARSSMSCIWTTVGPAVCGPDEDAGGNVADHQRKAQRARARVRRSGPRE